MKQLLIASIILVAGAAVAGNTSFAAEIEGFTEPYRDIDVAASEAGTLMNVQVEEGESVTAGQVLATLDDSILQATLAIADADRNAKGRLTSAQAELKLKTERLEKLTQLLDRSHATQQEVDRTAAETSVAEARVLEVREELKLKQLEYARIQAQIEQRRIRTPISGIVTRTYRDAGEYVSPADAVVMNVVQLDPLMAVFSAPSNLVAGLQRDQTVRVTVGENDGATVDDAVVEFVSPVTDARSGTVRIKVRVPNSAQTIRSGEKCRLVFDVPPARLAEKPKL